MPAGQAIELWLQSIALGTAPTQAGSLYLVWGSMWEAKLQTLQKYYVRGMVTIIRSLNGEREVAGDLDNGLQTSKW